MSLLASPNEHLTNLSSAAGQSMSLTATQLEQGDDGLSGRLGDGAGKWRLRVESNRPLSVMSLLESSSGHLTNLSTAGTGV